MRSLHQVVDSIPSRVKWTTRDLWYRSDPDAKHTIHYRGVIEAVEALLGNPAHAKDIVYRPKRIFTNASKDKRIYHEMWTGEWWSAVQVSTNHYFTS